LPAVKKPKLSRIQRNAINNAIEQVQEWVSENEVAVRAQAHAGVDWALGKINGVLKQAHPTVDDVIGWAKGKLATLKV
jgi:hypothetical protein